MFADYRRSLKLPEAEELFDLIFYRPVGYIFVRLIYRTRVTPNQVTALSTLSGLAAAYMFGQGTTGGNVAAGILYCVANVLDCADGQLARLQKSGTLLGRVVDGIGDYVASTAIFLCIGIGLAASGMPDWLLVIAAGLSSALHAMLFDHYQGAFIVAVSDSKRSPTEEQKLYSDEIARLVTGNRSWLKILMLRLYLRYLKIQQTQLGETYVRVDPDAYRASHLESVRFWSYLGPTTNRTVLILSALTGHLHLYLWTIVIGGNCWIPVCALFQKRAERRLNPLRA